MSPTGPGRTAAALSLWSAAAALLYSIAVEPYNVEVRRLCINLPRLPLSFDGFTVLQLSDFHTRQIGRRERIVRSALENLPEVDVTLITGDMIHTPDGASPFLTTVSSVRTREGSFAVFGNSEHKNGVNPLAFTETLLAAGIRPLLNKSVTITRGSETIAVAGVDDPVNELDRTADSLAGVPDAAFKLLMMHSPDSIADAVHCGVDLVLSGHTHGGQVRLPVIGAPFTHSHFGPRMSSGYYSGNKLRRVVGIRPGRTQLYVTRGIGISGIALRFLCRPEITLITLRRGAPAFRIES